MGDNNIAYYTGNKFVKLIDELGICGCGDPNMVYRLIHKIMKNILENGVRIDDEEGYYDFVIHQLNRMEFLCHGSSIYGSFVTKKGEALVQALEEMSKYDYEYEDFYDNNVVAVMEGE